MPTGPANNTPDEFKRFNKFTMDQIEGMKQQFGDAEIYKNPDRLADLQRSYEAKQSEVDLLYRAYERRAG